MTIAAVQAIKLITCSRGLRLDADCLLHDLQNAVHILNVLQFLIYDKDAFDIIILPGGLPGAKTIAEVSLQNPFLTNEFQEFASSEVIANVRTKRILDCCNMRGTNRLSYGVNCKSASFDESSFREKPISGYPCFIAPIFILTFCFSVRR